MTITTFINLPVRDLATSAEFFRSIGFTGAQPSPDRTSIMLSLNETTQLILHIDSAFAEYTEVGITDTETSREVIVGLAAESHEQVDELVDRAAAAGGNVLGPGRETGQLYMRGFRDLDGHQWSFVHVAG
ncbi:glyoxalase/bleomycin resistance/extradiol dioxygenase family protein [Micromonospora musae]|uniref:Glyoxalase/bleomycin resistance/extradiol dioxygenase family protein n=1 Tax=Micromonospora musae TaxID=1894970 RepID=A0A3A9YH25_9ACTN|nr:VOC family protein [Micromonospora musae]RKN21296.1 glyoxalase/bleomycin resistance/extradiol dioxygenase family protein [Micromonospora musae]RKN36360.1 glyoxalase/bleomycin resistance/extradiol dioxygenase family protein [Micromonospora musae]